MKIDLNTIHSPHDLRKLPLDELPLLSEELRAALIKKLAAHGGHVGPNLGVVEATVALHYVYDTPKDKIVWDVSHQSYVHKMLTGRMEAFTEPAHYGDVSGYTSPKESPEYDLFEVGHTSTSISLATGLAKSRDLQGGDWKVVAFIGDASLGGGMALEALNYAPCLGSDITIVLNDNQRSIADNHGALYRHLEELRQSDGRADNNIFKALGYHYIYVKGGNDVLALVKALRQARETPGAVLVHIDTMKGEGLPVAVAHKEQFHWSMPFDPSTGAPLHQYPGESYDDIFARHMSQRISREKDLVLLTAGTPATLGFLEPERRAAGSQFVDVGIAEQDAVAMAAGLAKGGSRPVMGVGASFMQRAYDQFEHDVAINRLPATFVIFYAGVGALNDVTHLGLFDIAMMSNIPGIRYLAPASAEEYLLMIDKAVDRREGPVVVRTPGGKVRHVDASSIDTDFTRYQVIRKGEKVAIIGAGTFLPTALEAADLLKAKGVEATVINPRILSQVDGKCLDSLCGYERVITLEDGIADGGFGQKVAAYLSAKGVEVHVLGLKKELLDRYDAGEVLKANSMTAPQVADIALAGVK